MHTPPLVPTARRMLTYATRAAQGSARHPEAKGMPWVLKKKELARQRGYANIPADTKYTGRKRKARF